MDGKQGFLTQPGREFILPNTTVHETLTNLHHPYLGFSITLCTDTIPRPVPTMTTLPPINMEKNQTWISK